MTLRQLLDKVRLSDLNRTLVASVNGEEAVPVRNVARDVDEETGETRLILTNEEEPAYPETDDAELETIEEEEEPDDN